MNIIAFIDGVIRNVWQEFRLQKASVRNMGVCLTLLLSFSACMEYAPSESVMSLNSSDHVSWEVQPQSLQPEATGEAVSQPGFRMADPVPGVVPGVTFTSYVEAGREEDPNYADNIYRVDETFYSQPFWYRAEFELPESYSEGKRVWLHFDNTNRFADFYFNGTKISGSATSTKDVSGHMIRSRFDVTELIRPQEKNAVAVLIYDTDQKKTRDDKGPYGVACSPSYLAGAGWDWMPYVPGRLAGITGHAYLKLTGDAVLEDPWVRSELPDLQQAEISLSTGVQNRSSETKEITLSGTIQPGNITFSKKVRVEGNATLQVAIDKKEFPQLVVDNPKLWWPNGYGDPNLYTCKLLCSVDGEVSDVKDITFGIKKYEYKMVNNAVGYPVLTFYINGQKIYLKGGNWGMSEYLLRCHGKEYETKVRLHKEMNYNMIRLWTGCVTDDEFYDYCDRYGIMVWNDFWLYVAYNDVAQPEAFKANALDKVKRLRNHPCIAIWCGANETHPAPELDNYLREVVAREDHNDRMYKSCSNQDGLSGSGWWGNQPPRHHFDTPGSNLAFNNPPYPYGSNYGYGLRTEIGTATFPTFESVKEFIPEKDWWPLPTDEQLKEDDQTVWNRHFFGKEASNANPVNYKRAVNEQYGESKGLEEFCEKAQLLNIEVMKGMYEAWNDKMWDDAAGLLIWMSHPAYPSFVWQTYDYYYDPTGAYWGAKKACEHLHIQWNASTNSIKVINTTSSDLKGAIATATVYNLDGSEASAYGKTASVDVAASNRVEAFVLNLPSIGEGFKQSQGLTPLHFIRLRLTDAQGKLLSENFYWRNGEKELDYTPLNTLPEAPLSCTLVQKTNAGRFLLRLKNTSSTVSFANRIRLVNATTGERVLPAIFSDNYVTLLPGEECEVNVEIEPGLVKDGVNVLLKQYGYAEQTVLTLHQ